MTVLSQRRNRAYRQGMTLAMTALALILSGCSATPEWARPTTWYSDAMSGLGGKPADDDGADPTASADASSPDDAAVGEADPSLPTPVEPDAGFPNLATVPDRPLQPVTSTERAEVSEALAADRNNANYTDEQLRGGAEVAAAPPRTVKPAVVAAPAPAAAPAPRASVAAPAKKAPVAVSPVSRPAAAPDSFSALFAASGAKRLPGASQ
jgi:hypothetical protein